MIDAWVVEYNTDRPHQSLGRCTPVERVRRWRRPGRPCGLGVASDADVRGLWQQVRASTGPGRPSVYCSPGCRKAHERVLSRAMHSLAKDRFPADDDRLDAIQEALDDAQALARAWSDDGPALIQEPSPRARAALAGRVNKLEWMRDRARSVGGREAEQRRWAEEQRRWAAEQAEAEGRRRRLATGAARPPPGD